MRSRCLLLLLTVLSLAVGAAGCGGSDEGNNLSRALAMAPTDVTEVAFTDWSLLKSYAGVQNLNSQSSAEARMEFLKALTQGQASASAFAVARFVNHAETWGWDSTDLLWEETMSAFGIPTYVLKLRDDFELAPVLARFQERGFSTSDYQGVTIYSHEMDVSADWLRTTEFGILNTAVLPKEKILVLSSKVDGVQAVLDVHQGRAGSLAGSEAVKALVNQLGEVGAVVIFPTISEQACPVAKDTLPAELVDRLPGPFRAYQSFGLGYRYEGSRPVGLAVLHFASAGDAQADLAGRQRVAAEEMSLSMKGRPYSDLFTVDKVAVVGSDLVLRLSPTRDMPRIFFELLWRRDLLFAICP